MNDVFEMSVAYNHLMMDQVHCSMKNGSGPARNKGNGFMVQLPLV